jgi:hypothetical protein
MRISGTWLVVFFLLARTAAAHEAFDVFYVAIGSGSYMKPQIDGIEGLDSIPGAVKSARAVAGLLQRGGSAFGITLVSDSSHFVGRDDMVKALWRVFEKIRTTHPRHPLFVVYFAGHGISNGFTWDHFSLPGNVVYREMHNSAAASVVMLDLTLNAATLVTWLRGTNLPFLVLLDTCYEGEKKEFYWDDVVPPEKAPDCSSDLSGFCAAFKKQVEPLHKFDIQMKEMAAGFNQMLVGFRTANRFEDTYPVLFSAEPGRTVATVADPYNHDSGALAVAPLARRAMLILTPALGHDEALSLEGFVHQMASPTFDLHNTSPAVTFSVMPKDASLLLISKVSHQGRFESEFGTATVPVVCCDDSSAPPKTPSPKAQ